MAKANNINDRVSLFPYQIKRVNNFYFRDHPKKLHPDSPKYKSYWTKFLEGCIEGRWILDKKDDGEDEGTWVYLMPKLFFYANYTKIEDANRDSIYPWIRDNEWIIFTYFMCLDGFSGFQKDDNYTCHDIIRRLENKEKLNFVDMRNIPESAKKPDGSYKKYVDPWHYLTRHYLIEHKATEPLGHALYENERYNGVILSSRAVGKSYTAFVGDFLHEFLFSGVKRMKDIGKVNNRLLFGMGSGKKPQLQRSINNVKSAYYNMPGQYKFPRTKEVKKQREDCLGPFFKRVQGGWSVGDEINHIIKVGAQVVDTQGSSLQMVALTPDRTTIGAGDRFRRIYFEEFGFLENAIDIHAVNKDSLKSGGKRVGSAVYLGTGGDMFTIKQPKEMFEKPHAYDVYGIPNYWRNPNKKVGLFISTIYSLMDYKDPEGNTYVNEAVDYVLETRAKDKLEKDSLSYELDIMLAPLNPDEMLRPGNSAILPKQDAQEQLNKIETYDLFKKNAQVGILKFNPLEPTGIEWKKDVAGNLRPLLDLKFDDTLTATNKDGAVIIYEQPPEHIPKELYWIIYDPAAKSGDGESFHSVIVYKHFYSGTENSMYDTIVGEWIGRKETLEENYMEVIKLAMYFNARIFAETNVGGFIDFCYRDGGKYAHLLEGDAWQLEQEIHGNAAIKRSYYKVGFQMNERKKYWCLRKLRDWLLEVKEYDPRTGVPRVRTMDWIFSIRFLNEIVGHTNNKNDNFDHISSALGLMLLIGKLDGKEAVSLEEPEDRAFTNLIPVINYDNKMERRKATGGKRAKILNY